MSKSNPPPAARIPPRAIAVYGSPMLAMGFMGTLLSIYLLKFATDVLLIAPGVMGLLLGLAFVWDAISDPVVGYLSDRTRSRFGRRRSWMFASALPVGLCFLAVWSPPAGLEGMALAVWLGVSLVLFFTASTMMAVPHMALGAELTSDYHDRSRVFGGRQIVDFAGIIVAAGAVSLLEMAGDEREMARRIALAGSLASVAVILFGAACTRERADYQGRGGRSAYAALRDVLGNQRARVLMGVFFCEMLGLSLLLTLLPYASEYLLGQPGRTGLFVASAIGSAVFAYPIWFPLSRRYGKRNPWIVATVVKAAAMGGMLFIDGGDAGLLLALTVVVGATQGAAMILGPSMKADVVDVDEYRTGERKEGSYFAIWNLARKAATGLAIAASGAVLQLAGFEPNMVQTRESELALRGLFGGLPMTLHVLAALLLLRFRLGREEHDSMRRTVEARRSQLATEPSA